MRQILVGASVLVITMSSLLAAPKKRPTATKTAKPNRAGSGAVDPGAIEMDGAKPVPDAENPAEAPPPAFTGESSTAAPPAAGPSAINDRPLTLDKGRLEVHAGLPLTVVTLPTLTGGSTTSTSAAFAFGATYGVADKVEIGGDYAISIHPGDIKGALSLHGAYIAIAKPTYDLAVGGAFIVHPIEYQDPASQTTYTTTYVAIQGGAWFRYRAMPALTVFTGLPALPHPDLSLSRAGLAFPPMPYQLTIGLNNSGAVGLSLPVGVGYQATPNIYAFAATNIANIKIAHTSNALVFADFIPLTVGGFYSLKQFDVGATFSDDLKQPADYLTFSIVARYFVR